MQGFYFFVKFGLVLIYIWKVYRKKSSSIVQCSIHYLHFSFEKHVPSQVLKDFSVEDLETIPRTFLSKFSSEIYLSRIINYWGSIFTSYLTWETFSLVCVLSAFFSFFIFVLFLFLPVFSLTDTSDSQDRREQRGNHWLFCFPLLPIPIPTNIDLVHRDFYHFFLIDLFVITRVLADEICSPLKFAFYFHWCN